MYREKESTLGETMMKPLSSQVMLRIIDTRWMAHLQEMDYLKTGIGLRAFGQRDPLTEYREEAYVAFENLTATMYDDFLRTILRLEVAKSAPAPESINADDPLTRKMSYSSPEQALESSGVAGSRAASPAAAGRGAASRRPTSRTKTILSPRRSATTRARAEAARSSRTATVGDPGALLRERDECAPVARDVASAFCPPVVNRTVCEKEHVRKRE